MADGERHGEARRASGPTRCWRSASPWSPSRITWRSIEAMLVTGIKSKPVYAPLQRRSARPLPPHARPRAWARCRCCGYCVRCSKRRSRRLARTRVLLIPALAAGDAAPRGAARDRGSGPLQVAELRTLRRRSAARRIQIAAWRSSLMGTRLYVAGPESFIGLAMKIALEFNLNKDEIRAEECGTPGAAGVLHSLPRHRPRTCAPISSAASAARAGSWCATIIRAASRPTWASWRMPKRRASCRRSKRYSL